MIMEQGCRFRMDSGYGISARSPGITSDQEKAIGVVFNDTMNNLFPSLGSSVLTCAVQGQYALYARNTLRTDSHNRITLFTHSYVLPLASYSHIMREKPQMLLRIPMSDFMDLQGNSNLDALELSDDDSADMDVALLRKKYRLDEGGRYGKLLMGAYEALSSNRTLRLCDVDEDQAEQVVREITMCILDGLMPALKSRISFSSGADTRMRICVVRSTSASSASDLVFGVGDDRWTNLRTKDSIRVNFFQVLGAADSEQRQKILQQIDDWLCARGMIDCTSVQMIAAAYTLCCTELTADTRFSLFRTFGGAAGKSLNLDDANQLLTELMEKMVRANQVGPREISNIAEWYLQGSSDVFRALADKIIQANMTPVALCAALMKAALSLEMANNIPQMLHALCKRVAPDSTEIDTDTKEKLVLWIVDHNDDELLPYCQKIMKGYSPQQMMRLALNILRSDSRDGDMTDVECGVIIEVLRFLFLEKRVLDSAEYALFDSNISKFNGELKNAYVHYVCKIRVEVNQNMKERVKLLRQLSLQDEDFCVRMEGIMQASKNVELWEAYQTDKVLEGNLAIDEIVAVCLRFNTFNNPCGLFEQQVSELMLQEYEYQLKAIDADSENGNGATLSAGAETGETLSKPVRVTILERKRTATREILAHIKRMNVSTAMRAVMEKQVVRAFWNYLSYQQIFQNNSVLDHEIMTVTKRIAEEDVQIRDRMELLTACGQVRKNPKQTEGIVRLLMHTPSFRENAVRKEIMKRVFELIVQQIMRQQILNLDLLLLYSTGRTPEPKYDYDLIEESLAFIQNYLEKNNIPIPRVAPQDSVLLRGNLALLTELMRRLDKGFFSELPELTGRVVNALRIMQRERSNKHGLFARHDAPRDSGSSQKRINSKADRTMPAKKQPGKPNPFTEDDTDTDNRQKKVFWGKR